jgi:hypothetical protein
MNVTNDRTLEIVLGEAEPDAGILRMILEAEGFHIVGHASNDDELQRVLAWVQPSVIVLDGGISASAALGARERATSGALVVVWPAGVAAVVAEERVEPERVFDELGNAVRRASRHAFRRPLEQPQPSPARVRRDAAVPAVDRSTRPISARRLSLVTASTWLLFLVALTTIAVAVPAALIRSERSAVTGPTTRPHRSPIADRPSQAPPTQPAGAPTTPESCRAVHEDRAHGKGTGAVTSCGRGRPGEGWGHGNANGHDRSSRGNGGGGPQGNANGHTKEPRSARRVQPTPPVEPGRRAGHARSSS